MKINYGSSKLLGLALLCGGILSAKGMHAQSYTDSLLKQRQHYKDEFLTDSHSPLKAEDTGYLRFFAPDAAYRVVAKFRATPDAQPFNIPTASGKKKSYRQYGLLEFRIKGKACSLQVYQSQDLMKMEEYKNLLFVPFRDLTNYEATYGGGRYLDLSILDITNNTLVLDFNRCYNPYCAYAGGYNCPIPPEENTLKIAIKAGEKLFGREVGEH